MEAGTGIGDYTGKTCRVTSTRNFVTLVHAHKKEQVWENRGMVSPDRHMFSYPGHDLSTEELLFALEMDMGRKLSR